MGLADTARLYSPEGCENCRRTGYEGRRGIFELIRLDDTLREMILNSRSAVLLRDAARARGMRTLAEDGTRLVGAGITSFEEVLRVSRVESASSNGERH
jgi:type II secretory ATPase GspE/PulE/Tfp pilus assembly ATPase PilB-like protein